MSKEEVYSKVLELRKMHISILEDFSNHIKFSLEYFTQNKFSSKEFNSFIIDIRDELVISESNIFNSILKLIHEIE